MRRTAAILGALALTLSACLEAPDSVADATAEPESRVVEGSTDLRADQMERVARQGTLRVRNRTCLTVSSGSGWVLDRRTLVTNAHVVRGAHTIQLSTWDGRSLDTEVVGVATADDLAIVRTAEPLDVILPTGSEPQAGDEIVAVGYPGGGRVTFSEGTVVDAVDGHAFMQAGEVVRLDADIRPGNSGGPVLNADGEVVAVAFAIELATGYGLAVPVETLDSLMRSRGFFDQPPAC